MIASPFRHAAPFYKYKQVNAMEYLKCPCDAKHLHSTPEALVGTSSIYEYR